MSWTVIQAEGRGVTGTRQDGTPYFARKLEDVAPGGWFRLIRPPAHVDLDAPLAFWRQEVGAKYAKTTIASIALEKVTPPWFHWPIRRPGTWECSALGAEGLRTGGWIWPWVDVYQVDPAEAMHALLASGGTEIDVAQAVPGCVGFAHSRGLIGAAIRFAQRGEPDSEVNHMFMLDRYFPAHAIGV